MTKKSIYSYALFSVVLIMITAVMGSFDLTVQKWGGLICAAGMVVLMLTKHGKNALKAYTVPLFLATAAYVIWNGISIFYADVPKLALFEFTKLLAASAVFLTVLSFTSPTKKGIKAVSSVFALSAAFFSVVSIDAGSNGPIATGFKAVMGIFTNSMQAFGFFENGIRITGIFGNANTFSGYLALGIFLSLALVINSASKKERTFGIILLAVNSLGYILLFSLGSLFMFFIACILMISVSAKGQKLPTFILMAETACITLIFTGVSLISLGSSPWLPLLAVILNAAVLWAADSFISTPMVNRISKNPKNSLIAGAVAVVLLLGYAVAALNVTGPLTLTSGEPVMRGLYLEAGDYHIPHTWTSESDDAVPFVLITSQNDNDLKVHTSTQLYSGPLSEAAFTVPEDSRIVKVYFSSSAGSCTIEKASYDGSESGEIKLGYKLLPAIAANRIQDIKANENSIQRIVFFEDGIKLFKQSPLIGKGLSGYETGVASVQNFYYETRYVHNHYIQALCDLGIVGFVIFMLMLVFCVMSVFKLFKRSRASGYSNAGAFALPVMAACIFQMFGQALTDLTWSAGPFLIAAFGIMALLIIVSSKAFDKIAALQYDDDIEPSAEAAIDMDSDNHGKITGSSATRAVIAVLSLIMTVLLVLNLYSHYRASTGNCTLEEIETFSKIDKFESDDYKTTYIVTVSTYGMEEYFEKANRFADELTNNTDVVLNYLLPYYFNTAQDDKLYETAAIAAHNGRSSEEIWNRLFEIFDTAFDTSRENPVPIIMHLFGNKEYYVDGIIELYKDLQHRNRVYLDEANLTPANIVFFGKLLGLQQLTTSDLPQAIEIFGQTVFDSQFAVDVNNDLIPDNITVTAGETVWGQHESAEDANSDGAVDDENALTGFDGSVTIEAGTTMNIEAYCTKAGEYTLRFDGLTDSNGNRISDASVKAGDTTLPLSYDEAGAYVTLTLAGAVEADDANGIKAQSGTNNIITVTFPSKASASKVTVKK